jgi:hypothetical protein
MEVFPGDDDISVKKVDAMVEELCSVGLLHKYEVNGEQYLIVTGWKHQRVDKPSFRYPLPNGRLPIADKSPNSRLPFDDGPPAESKGGESKGKGDSPLPPKGGVSEAPHVNGKDPEADQAFEAFWQRWPHKVEKPDAYRAFPKALAKAGSLIAILEGVRRYIAAKPPDVRFCNPATFLNQERWLDQPAPGHGATDPRGTPPKPTRENLP